MSQIDKQSGGEKEMRFEEAFKKLQEIVNSLESGQMPLEDLLQKYEEGRRLLKICDEKLNEAEQRIIVLSAKQDNGGGAKEN
ncbi:exodeoxyribonuclease VII small subunit [Candidatus Methylacidiphilum fumarolicum]|uniref:Exodeoxyribonuclease 7 small subunit n=2 Tax=Candidatus Methylacidiphilum fumarolicum TaxID=591154 RepID=I0JXE1_METFB|nr:exodeoxyribonuclease VII small subunit [Candidatus Methylacidiphilum fumarolicum]MBW6415311.1 exodeoxyribonuclease VII small subunit [Candidatus Methylacidiphilum fumarolicum]TFE69290.1 exodeoxyribonuclease VII small subunit [Candidatus Methylacidiphilum fumarolicum]TFE72187.1 exodeoxyribonuclease VII small subunit [Candidatus Methylacidiphilum fumarolicum]TFE72328.1 exodeoxyribonuclease VII small subunit [Candidatus Methylacidiphilum fumarolicum]TFE77016.1 exodeoxyribonuclease VII small su